MTLSACSSSSGSSVADLVDGSAAPYGTSVPASVDGSSDFTVADVTRDAASFGIQGTITYTGSCNLVKSELRFSYIRGGQTVTGKTIDGIDTHFELGPLAPNEPYQNSYLGEDKFTPDAIVFVISAESCARCVSCPATRP
jgi:hypothetical protein